MSLSLAFGRAQMIKLNNAGRSMIEMLGVLAIIGVLSVGGIAGYSKAMTKFKINKMIEDYSNLTFNLVENYPNLLKSYSSVKTKNSELYNLAKDMGWIPDSWKPRAKSKTIYLDDGHNNLTHLFMRYNSDVDKRRVIMDIYIGSNIDNFDQLPQVSLENCMAIFSNWLVPMADVIYYAGTDGSASTYFYGNATCGGDKKCLSSMTLSDIHNICKVCKEDQQKCYIAVNFLPY